MTEQTATRLSALRQRMAETGTGLVLVTHRLALLGLAGQQLDLDC